MGLQQSGPARPVKHHKLREHGREVSASAVVFRLIASRKGAIGLGAQLNAAVARPRSIQPASEAYPAIIFLKLKIKAIAIWKLFYHRHRRRNDGVLNRRLDVFSESRSAWFDLTLVQNSSVDSHMVRTELDIIRFENYAFNL
ncbi:hypothetical protein EVAR_6376_1 [Eumeta japonica]|uniref:Uncharacterized protein n=1 Tax=Eumeta variegata TaxID=151549 RepID=A0A4C1TDA8_EUMVA|nr:hypothetical protein EVAR_6376_1 [Eumeta japonica]